MKIVILISRILLGLAFVVFGLNGFLHFIPQPPPAPGPATDFTTVLVSTHYILLPFALQLVSGVLFLINRYVPLALTLIGPVIVNILLFHLTMAPASIPPGILVTVLWGVVFWSVRSSFEGILSNRAAA